MKKIFTLIAAVVMAVGASAQKMEYDLSMESASQWSAGWGADVTLESGIIKATNKGDDIYGAAGYWIGSADWSEYASLTIEMEYCSGGWGQFYVKDVNDKLYVAPGFRSSTSKYTMTIDLTGMNANAKQVVVQSTPHSSYAFSRVYLTKKVEYEAPKQLETDQYGNCYASQFNGLSDYAKIVYTYNTTGELTGVNQDGTVSSRVGWGTGNLHSCDGKVDLGNINVKELGDNTITFTLKDIKAALNSGPSQYNTYGLNWYFYPQGNSTTKFVKIEAYQVKGFEGEGYRSPDTQAPSSIIGYENNTTGWWTAFSDYYTVPEGQKAYVSFKNYSNKEKNWNNWMAVFTPAGAERGAEGYSEYGVIRCDNYGWGKNVGNNKEGQGLLEGASLVNNYNWDTFLEDMNGSKVDMELYNVAGVIYGTAAIKATNGNTYSYSFNTTNTGAKDFTFFLTVEKGHLTDLEVNVAKIPEVVGDEVHAFYNWFLKCANALGQREEFAGRSLGDEYQAAAYPLIMDYDAGVYDGKMNVIKDELADAFLGLFAGTSLESLAKMYVSQAKGENVSTAISNVAAGNSRTGKFVQNGRVVIVKNGKAYTTTGALLK